MILKPENYHKYSNNFAAVCNKVCNLYVIKKILFRYRMFEIGYLMEFNGLETPKSCNHLFMSFSVRKSVNSNLVIKIDNQK